MVCIMDIFPLYAMFFLTRCYKNALRNSWKCPHNERYDNGDWGARYINSIITLTREYWVKYESHY